MMMTIASLLEDDAGDRPADEHGFERLRRRVADERSVADLAADGSLPGDGEDPSDPADDDQEGDPAADDFEAEPIESVPAI